MNQRSNQGRGQRKNQHRGQTWKKAIAPRTLALTLTLTLVFALLLPAQAQSSLLDSKVARLEFVVQQLETRVNQLATQRPATKPSLSAPIPQPRPAQQPSAVSREEFNNLATLVIELKQEIDSLSNNPR